MAKTISKNKKYVIIDTNIFQYFSRSKELSNGILDYVQEAIKEGYDLAMSDISIFELLDGSTLDREKEALSAIAGLPRIFVTKSILIAAAHLGCLYNEDGLSPDQISLADKVIGASAVLTNSLILTGNIRDFPEPFFSKVAYKDLKYSKKRFDAYQVIAFMKPEFGVIGKRHETRTSPTPIIVDSKSNLA